MTAITNTLQKIGLRGHILFLACILYTTPTYAQSTFTLRGRVQHADPAKVTASYTGYGVLDKSNTVSPTIDKSGNFVLQLAIDAPVKIFVNFGQVKSEELIQLKTQSGMDTSYTANTNKHQYFYVYATPNREITFEADANSILESLTINGGNNQETNYLNQEELRFNAYRDKVLKNYYGYTAYSLDTYEAYVKQREEDRMNFLRDTNQKQLLSPSFYRIQEHTIKLDALLAKVNYPKMRSTYTKLDYQAPDGYYDFLLKMDLDIDVADKSTIYFQQLDQLIKARIQFIDAGKSKKEVAKMLLSASTYYEYMAWSLSSDFREEVYTLFDDSCPYPQLAKAVHLRYGHMENMLPGRPAPNISFSDGSGKKYTFSDFKGKYIYIDFWATWCGPCIEEIPSLKKIKEQFKDTDIAFVALSVDKAKDKEKWQKFIQQHNLGTHQYLLNEENRKLVSDAWNILQIPRFVLLDKMGNLIDANTRRPSDPKIIELLKSLNQQK